MTTYISLESIARCLRNKSATLIWCDGVVTKCAS